MRPRLAVPALACAVAVAAGSCGDNPEQQTGPEGPGVSSQLVPAQDTARVLAASETITLRCRHAPRRALRTLIEVYRENPSAVIDAGKLTTDKSMKQVLDLKADELMRCGNEQAAATLERAAASGS